MRGWGSSSAWRAFGFSFAALILAGAVYVSSSAVAVKGLIDFRRLADDETDLVLAILIVEDIAIAFVLAFAGGGGGGFEDSLALAAKAITFIVGSLAASRWLARPIDRVPRMDAAGVLPPLHLRAR